MPPLAIASLPPSLPPSLAETSVDSPLPFLSRQTPPKYTQCTRARVRARQVRTAEWKVGASGLRPLGRQRGETCAKLTHARALRRDFLNVFRLFCYIIVEEKYFNKGLYIGGRRAKFSRASTFMCDIGNVECIAICQVKSSNLCFLVFAFSKHGNRNNEGRCSIRAHIMFYSFLSLLYQSVLPPLGAIL